MSNRNNQGKQQSVVFKKIEAKRDEFQKMECYSDFTANELWNTACDDLAVSFINEKLVNSAKEALSYKND